MRIIQQHISNYLSKVKFRISYICYFIILISCGEEQSDWQLDSVEQNLMVVEGVLTNEHKIHSIKISRLIYHLNDPPQSVSVAIVALSDGDNILYLEKDSIIPGKYNTPIEVHADYGKIYTLYIRYNNKEYYARDYMTAITSFNPATYKSIGNFYRIDSVCEEYNLNEAARYNIHIDWSHVPGFENKPVDSSKALLNYYTLTTIDVNQVFKPDKQTINFPKGSIIIEKKYSLSPDHEKFIRSMLTESEWRGGYFDVAPANVYTNLSEGAIGFFGVSAVLSDTIIVR